MSQAACGSRAWPHSFIRSRTSSTTVVAPATAPAMTSEWPFRYFVALWITTSAPSSRGRKFIGVAKVESTSSAIPSDSASTASHSTSSSRISGLVGVSTKMARVFFRSLLRHSRRRSGFTNDTSMPNRLNSSRNSRRVPP